MRSHHPYSLLGPDPLLKAVLEHLFLARHCAEGLQLDVWTFAVELTGLLSLGCTSTHLRLLVGLGFVDHAEEVTRPYDSSRTYQPETLLKFGPNTCFVINENGVKFLASLGKPPENEGGQSNDSSPLISVFHENKLPAWDAEARELWVGRQLVKRFTRPAPMLELVLAAFQELAWPPHVDDPMPPNHGIVPMERLRDTVRRLNRCQEPQRIRFESDGLGMGIRWSWVDCDMEKPVREPRFAHT